MNLYEPTESFEDMSIADIQLNKITFDINEIVGENHRLSNYNLGVRGHTIILKNKSRKRKQVKLINFILIGYYIPFYFIHMTDEGDIHFIGIYDMNKQEVGTFIKLTGKHVQLSIDNKETDILIKNRLSFTSGNIKFKIDDRTIVSTIGSMKFKVHLSAKFNIKTIKVNRYILF